MTESSESSAKQYSLTEITKHNSNNSSWIVIHNNIYDVTAFLNEVRINKFSFIHQFHNECSIFEQRNEKLRNTWTSSVEQFLWNVMSEVHVLGFFRCRFMRNVYLLIKVESIRIQS